MLEMEVFKQDLAAVRSMLDEAGKSLQIDHLREQLVEYNEDMGSPGFWDDTERAQKVSAKASGVESRIKHYEPEEKAKDEARTAYLESLGLQVVRFSNYDVDVHFESVCATIDGLIRDGM